MTSTTLRPHRAKIDEAIAEAIKEAFPHNAYDVSRAVVRSVLLHTMYSELPYAKDGMPTSETAEIIRFNRRLREIMDEII